MTKHATDGLTAEELVLRAHAARPEIVYRAARNGQSVAAWQKGRWIAVAGRTLMGTWASIEYELLINGKPGFPAELYGEAPTGQETRP